MWRATINKRDSLVFIFRTVPHQKQRCDGANGNAVG